MGVGVILVSSKSRSADYYVAEQGADSNPGTFTSPFRTIRRALSVVSAGDTVTIRAGTYHEANLAPPSGSSGATVTIRAYSGERVVLDGQNRAGRDDGFYLWKTDYVEIEGLEITRFIRTGMTFEDCSHITVRNCFVHHNGTSPASGEGQGIYIQGSHFRIENNVVNDNCPDNDDGGSGICNYAAHNSVLAGNVCDRNRGNGILVEDAHDVLVEGNTCRWNRGDFGDWYCGGLWVDGGFNVTVRNNWFEGNEGAGIEMSDETPADPYGYVAYNNVCVGNYWGIWLNGIGREGKPPNEVYNNTFVDNTRCGILVDGDSLSPRPASLLRRLRLFNNISAQFGVGRPSLCIEGSIGPDVLLDNNLYFLRGSAFPVWYGGSAKTFARYQAETGQDAGGKSEDPRLVDPGAHDFRLRAGSPCIDAGSGAYRPGTDYDGNARTGTPDTGAFEYTTNSSPALIIEPGELRAGSGFSFTVKLRHDINSSFDYYILAETRFGIYTLYLDGRVGKGIKPLYKNVPAFSAPFEITVAPGPVLPPIMSGDEVGFTTAAVEAGMIPPVNGLDEVSQYSPYVILLDREIRTVE